MLLCSRKRGTGFLYPAPKGLGILNFGDGTEWEYMKQGRSGGELIWINNEYDMPHNLMVMFARSGARSYFDYMKTAIEHWYDVDLRHYSGQLYKCGLLYTHIETGLGMFDWITQEN